MFKLESKSGKSVKGKRQIDIRESNKSVVIDLMLQEERSSSDLEKELDLSHTALNKVLKELMQLNVVLKGGLRANGMGRPSAVYSINSDCAIAAAISFNSSHLSIYFVDMRGYEINRCVTDINCGCKEEFLEMTFRIFFELKEHYRIKNNSISTLCISIPSYGAFGTDYDCLKAYISGHFSEKLKGCEIIAAKETEFACTAECKYGILRRRNRNAMLLSFSENMAFSLYINKSLCYSGDSAEPGSLNYLLKRSFRESLEELCCLHYAEILIRYAGGEPEIISKVNAFFKPCFRELALVTYALGIEQVVVFGDAHRFGNGLTDFMNKIMAERSGKIRVDFSEIKNRTTPCAGAVWHATYNSLKNIIIRE